MTEHPPFAALPVPCNAAFQEHSGAGSEQVHAVFGSGVQCFGPVIYQALCTSMLGKELSTGVVNMGLGEPGPRPSYVPAEVMPVPEGYVPSAIDESAQQQKWGSRIGGEHHGAELWHLPAPAPAPPLLTSQRPRRPPPTHRRSRRSQVHHQCSRSARTL